VPLESLKSETTATPSVTPRTTILNIRPHMLAPPASHGAPATVLLNSNESALGPSPAALESARDALARIERYPEDAPEQLAVSIGTAFGLDPARIVCGPGSDELLSRIARAYLQPGDELIHSAHGYLKFPNYAHANGAVPVAAPDDRFRASVEGLLASVNERTRVVMLANPDNPTGTHLSGAEIRRVHGALPGNVLLVLDCAYAEYAGAPDYEVAAALVEAADNVVMTRTFSKIFGLAGLRLGWLYAPLAVADILRRIGTTFPISGAALAAGTAALGDVAHRDAVRAHNDSWRGWLSDRLTTLGLQVTPSQCNFILVRFDDPAKSAAEASRYLAERGIVVRRFNSPDYRDYVRITVGHEHEMHAVADALGAFLEA
jgi:histidinol-phosphate aminotransferase